MLLIPPRNTLELLYLKVELYNFLSLGEVRMCRLLPLCGVAKPLFYLMVLKFVSIPPSHLVYIVCRLVLPHELSRQPAFVPTKRTSPPCAGKVTNEEICLELLNCLLKVDDVDRFSVKMYGAILGSIFLSDVRNERQPRSVSLILPHVSS